MFYSIIRRGGATSTTWTPSQLTYLKAWYDVSAETGYVDGDAITSLVDQSGNGNTISGTGTFNASALNGLPSITQSNDWAAASTTDFDGLTRVAIYQVVADASGASLYISGSSSTSRLNLQNLGTSWRTLMTQGGGNTIAPASVNPTGFQIAGSLAAALVGSGNTRCRPLTRINGTQYTGNYSGADVGFLSAGHIIGMLNSGAGQRVCECVLVGDASSYEFDDQTPDKIEGYLAHKWGLTGSLPAAHPYKSVAPTA